MGVPACGGTCGREASTMKSSVLVILGLLFASAPSAALAKRRALLVANEGYHVAEARLTNPVYDATQVQRALEQAGYTARLVEDATRERLRDAVDRFVAAAKPSDELVFYYAGHGIAIRNTNYLLGIEFEATSEAEALSRRADTFEVDLLVKRLEDSRARLRVVIIDACRDEPFTKGRGWAGRGLGDDYRGFTAVAAQPVARGTLLAFATGAKQRARDVVPGIRGGPYAHWLARLLPTPGLRLYDLFNQVGLEVEELTDGEQSPDLVAKLRGGSYYFVAPREEPRVAEVRRRPTPRPDPDPPRRPQIPEGMVAVPSGPFFMGCNEKVDSECDDDEKPGRTVNLPTFFIDRTEVTVNAYAACVRARRCSEPATGDYYNWGKSGRDEHPINGVNWEQATEYCAWKGHRLPTEPEWEKAARGTDGRKYAWGNAGYRQTKYANIADETAKRTFSYLTIAEGYEDGFVETAPVGSFPRGESPYGALDMIGNVWEWTSGWYSSERKHRVNRGGSWRFEPALARASYRNWNSPSYRGVSLGFRCARAAD